MIILAIDPGTTESAVIAVDSQTYEIVEAGILPNEDAVATVRHGYYDDLNIEWIRSYGMAVGDEVFATCMAVGRMYEAARPSIPSLVPRMDVKMHICHDARAKDGNIIAALKSRFESPTARAGKGWFKLIKADLWQAYALAVYRADKLNGVEW